MGVVDCGHDRRVDDERQRGVDPAELQLQAGVRIEGELVQKVEIGVALVDGRLEKLYRGPKRIIKSSVYSYICRRKLVFFPKFYY